MRSELDRIALRELGQDLQPLMQGLPRLGNYRLVVGSCLVHRNAGSIPAVWIISANQIISDVRALFPDQIPRIRILAM